MAPAHSDDPRGGALGDFPGNPPREESAAAARRKAREAHERAQHAAQQARQAWKDALTVKTTAGWIHGIRKRLIELDEEEAQDHNRPSPDQENGSGGPVQSPVLRCWRGITFGADTSGHNRFRAPRPPEPWEGIRECIEYGNIAPQTTYSWTEKIIGDEDCLNLDIVRPDTDDTLPVVVYLHGGSFIVGSSHMAMLQGHHLAQAMDVVYVSINFRLGPLGYLDLRSLSEDCVANPAVQDQLLALQWVRDNIAGFGGDPNNVTLMGESAGGAGVLTLMAAPPAEGLFHRAIAQSPPIGMIHSRTQSTFWARELVHRLALPRTASVEDLRNQPFEEVVRAGQSMMWRVRELFHLNSCYAPTVDGELIPDHPLTVFDKGQQMKVPLLIGSNADEASITKLLYVRTKAREFAGLRLLKSFDETGAEAVVAAYNGARSRKDFADLLSDALFWAPSVRTASAHSQIAPTWMYRFDFASQALRALRLGAMHSMELTNIFGDPTASRAAALLRLGSAEDMDSLTESMQATWARFIHHGDPGEDWQDYGNGRATKIWDWPPRMEADPNRHKREAWENYHMLEWGAGRPELMKLLGFDEPD